ncbi:MAG: hypothetical protein H6817_09120 [Phycisphaerales bacterium]|nr:hypothetical protein [Phycisphaerales bacterium]
MRMCRDGWLRGLAFGLLLAVGALPVFADEQAGGEAAGAVEEAASPQVLAVLDALEAAGTNLKTIQCAVVYSTDDKLNVTKTAKYGTIQFKRAEPHPLFLITFDKTDADGILMRNKEWWLFRDRWLWEAKSKGTLIIKREYLAPGEKVDFFNLEKSPIPMPFGQTRQEVLDNFHVKVMPPQVGDPPETDHLYCVPRDGNQLSREYRRLEYYVDRSVHLPVRIVAEDANGEKVNVANFMDIGGNLLTPQAVNQEIPDSAFALPAETHDYHVSEEPLQGPGDTPPDQGGGIGKNMP